MRSWLVVVLAGLSLADLRLEWRRLFRADPPRLSRDIMMRAIAYRLQEIAHGGASKVTQRRLMTLTAEFETGGTIAPPPGPKIKPGSRLVREWHGRTRREPCAERTGFPFGVEHCVVVRRGAHDARVTQPPLRLRLIRGSSW
jgi:Protein of unknown function (DUF2924)